MTYTIKVFTETVWFDAVVTGTEAKAIRVFDQMKELEGVQIVIMFDPITRAHLRVWQKD